MKRHTFSCRLDEDLFVVISDRAQAAGTDRNTQIVGLLRHGLVGAEAFEAAVKKFVMRSVTADDLLRLETGV